MLNWLKAQIQAWKSRRDRREFERGFDWAEKEHRTAETTSFNEGARRAMEVFAEKVVEDTPGLKEDSDFVRSFTWTLSELQKLSPSQAQIAIYGMRVYTHDAGIYQDYRDFHRGMEAGIKAYLDQETQQNRSAPCSST